MLKDLRQKSESYRQGVSLGAALFVTVIITGVWAQQNGLFGFSKDMVVIKEESDTSKIETNLADEDNSPIFNMKKAFSAAFSEIGGQYEDLKESVAAVIVPFMTGIEVYDKEQKN